MSRRNGLGAVVGILGLALCATFAGCDGGSSPPPIGDASIPVSVPEVVVVLPAVQSPELSLWELTLLGQAGRDRDMILTPLRPESPDAPPSRQAELVREAGSRAASAVIVVPGDPDLLAPALQSLREQGVAVVVLGKEVPIEGEPFPRVSAPPLEQVADDLVARASEAAKTLGVDPNGPATIIAPEALGDGRIMPRVEALKKALERADIPIATTITFRQGPENSVKKLEASRSEPNPSRLVFAVEDFGLLDAVSVRQDRAGRDDFITAGFADQRDVSAYLNAGGLNAVVIGTYREQAIQALKLAQALIAGEAPPPKGVEVDTPIRVSFAKSVQRVYTYGMEGLEPDDAITAEPKASVPPTPDERE